MTTSYTLEDGTGWHALYVNAMIRRDDGYGVIDPDAGDCLVSLGSGTLGQPDTLSVAAGDVLVAGTAYALTQTDVQIETANASDPRRDVVYVDNTGTIQVAKGTAEGAQPTGESLSRFEFYRPSPDDLAATQATPLAEVWVSAATSGIQTADVKDIRPSTIGTHSLDFDTATQAELDSHAANGSLHPSAGDGLVDNSGAFDIEPADFAGAGLEDDGSDNLRVAAALAGTGLTGGAGSALNIQERVHYEPGHTEIADGQDDVEYHRIVPPAGGTVTITAMQFNQQGGGTSSSATLDVYDADAASLINQITLGDTDRSTYTANAAGNTVLVRMSNSTGSTVDASPIIDGYID